MRKARIRTVAAVATTVVAAWLGAATSPGARAADDGVVSARRARTFVALPSRPSGGVGDIATDPGTERRSTMGTGRQSWSTGLPTAAFGFDAIPRIGGNWPADPTGAIGDSFFLTAVNTSFAVYDLTGAEVLGPDPLRPLFPLPSGTQVFDPKVVYDQYRDTFVLTFLGVNDPRGRSWILIVTIPNGTASDRSTWCGSKIVGDRTKGDGEQFADYPGLGYDAEHVVLTTNQFDISGQAYRGAQLLAFPKARLYDCSRRLSFDTFVGADTRNPDGTPAFTIQPATTVGPGGNLYLTSFQDAASDRVILWRLREGARGLALTNTAIKVPSVRIGPFGTQGGGSLGAADSWWDPGDLRLVNAFADLTRGRVFAAHVVARDFRPDTETGDYVEAGIRWYDIRPGSNLDRSRLMRSGTIGEAETDAGWPVVATDEAGNLFVTYSRASAVTGEFLSSWAAEIPFGSTADTSVMLAGGTARMEAVAGPERWGDYNGISRDPVNGTLIAMVNQHAVSDGPGPTDDWQQTVHVVSHG